MRWGVGRVGLMIGGWRLSQPCSGTMPCALYATSNHCRGLNDVIVALDAGVVATM